MRIDPAARPRARGALLFAAGLAVATGLTSFSACARRASGSAAPGGGGDARGNEVSRCWPRARTRHEGWADLGAAEGHASGAGADGALRAGRSLRPRLCALPVSRSRSSSGPAPATRRRSTYCVHPRRSPAGLGHARRLPTIRSRSSSGADLDALRNAVLLAAGAGAAGHARHDVRGVHRGRPLSGGRASALRRRRRHGDD